VRTDHSPLAEKLRRAREARGLTQLELSRLSDVDNTLSCRIERGLAPSAATLAKLARALHLTLSVEVQR